MPTSDPANISPIISYVQRLRPKSVLDLGIGMGKYGALLREYLDVEFGRLRPEEWLTWIEGVEAFERYRNPLWELYSNICIADFRLLNHSGYDLVLLIDSLEHIDKNCGANLLTQLMQQNKNVIVSCPTGKWYLEQGAVNGNEFERHRAHWTRQDFELLGGKIIHEGICVVAHLKGQG